MEQCEIESFTNNIFLYFVCGPALFVYLVLAKLGYTAMKRILVFLLLSRVITQTCLAQILPAETALLNYRLIAFSFPNRPDATWADLQIADGNFTSDTLFQQHIIRTESCFTGRVITEVPLWGHQYTWRTVFITGNSRIEKSELHHFTTMVRPGADTNFVRLRVVQPSQKYKDNFVCLDGNKAIHDMEGNMVWCMQERPFTKDDVRDIKLNNSGTLTFLVGEAAYEMNYNGDILWQAPKPGHISGDSTEHFHHEFTKLASGHYMLLGQASTVWKQSTDTGVNPVFPTLLEYNERGKLVWSWRSSTYFKQSDIFCCLPPSLSKQTYDITHANAFYFDEKNQVIYISFKTISRILKVKYPEGIVLDAWGEQFEQGKEQRGNGLFCRQHAVKCSDNGSIYLFNNNTCNSSSPSVVVLQQPGKKGQALKKIWEYQCRNENDKPMLCDYGGNVMELPDASMFINWPFPYSEISIVGRDKNTLWSAIPERLDPVGNTWEKAPQYRASIVDRKTMEKFIWTAEKQMLADGSIAGLSAQAHISPPAKHTRFQPVSAEIPLRLPIKF